MSKRFSVLDRWGIQYTFPEFPEQKQVQEYINSTYSPPLNAQFLCYLSIGYDAQITYNFQRERNENPERFKSQLTNQSVYVRMGLQQLFSPSAPVNDSIHLEIDGKPTPIPKNTRSLKVVNINSAANGIFFWVCYIFCF